MIEPIVRGYRDGGSDFEALDVFLGDEADDLNLDYFDAMSLSTKLRWEADLFLVAKEGERIVGITAIRRGASDRDEHVGMLRLHVLKEYRSNGVGAKLLRRALWWADRNGVTRTVALPYLDQPESAQSVRFFEKHGFEFEGFAASGARLLDGTFTDVATLARVR